MIMFVKTCFSVTQIIYKKGNGTAPTKKKAMRGGDKQVKNKEGGSSRDAQINSELVGDME